ncbi:hypothetical protein [Lacticaseibacillus yichunensis]|uniref:ABC transporter permease n=1 Tax=Lacticaseibacillus yichunensis TaxID=2486015 RepID=A0ABW4CPX7_9LACO|nr:hypothetical protein [Lacticaseibacillus yichunensis]
MRTSRVASEWVVFGFTILLIGYQINLAKTIPSQSLRLSDGVPPDAGAYYLWVWLMPILLWCVYQGISFADLSNDFHLYQLYRYRRITTYWLKRLEISALETLAGMGLYQIAFNSVVHQRIDFSYTLADLNWLATTITIVVLLFTLCLLLNPLYAVLVVFALLLVGTAVIPDTLIRSITEGIRGLMVFRLNAPLSRSFFENLILIAICLIVIMFFGRKLDIGGKKQR